MHTLLTDQLVGQIIGGYRVERLLGQGRLSAVYLARHPEQNSTVALNTFILPEQFSRQEQNRFMVRFTREALVLTTLNHRHVLPVYAYGEQFGYPYLVTPYMTHGSLADILKQEERCTPAYVLQVLEQVASGLDYAHRKGVVHGTLKPANMLINKEQGILVAGFGLMTMLQMRDIVESNQPNAHLMSIAGTFLGTPEYVAPEVVQGQALDARSDIYALGIVLFELLSGKPPFTGTSALDIAKQHVQQPLPSLHELHPDIPIALELVVNHALSRDPARRFQRPSELVEAFAQVCRGMSSIGSIGSISNRDTGNTPQQKPIEKQATRRNEGQLRATIFADELGDVAEQGTIAGNWQLMPPIMTNKTEAVRPSLQNTEPTAARKPALDTTGSWQLLPPIITGKLPSVEPPVKTTEPRVVVPQEPPLARETQQRILPAQPARPDVSAQPRSVTTPTQPQKKSEATDITPAEWWTHASSSQEEQASAVQPVQSVQPVRSSTPRMPVARQESMKLPAAQPVGIPLQPGQMANKPRKNSGDLVKVHPPKGKRSQPLPKRSKGVGRRKVVALLATGGVVAAGAMVAVNMNLLHVLHPTATTATTSNGTHTSPPANTPKQGTKPTQQPKGTSNNGNNNGNKGTGTTKPTQPAQGQTGTVIGSSAMIGPNTSADFRNPADGNASILVHLPTNNFVAYEKACTHEGVPVYYDAGSHMLVCPAHGSIFDPANHGAVIQGPATKPIASVTIQVNANGTITAV